MGGGSVTRQQVPRTQKNAGSTHLFPSPGSSGLPHPGVCTPPPSKVCTPPCPGSAPPRVCPALVPYTCLPHRTPDPNLQLLVVSPVDQDGPGCASCSRAFMHSQSWARLRSVPRRPMEWPGALDESPRMPSLKWDLTPLQRSCEFSS